MPVARTLVPARLPDLHDAMSRRRPKGEGQKEKVGGADGNRTHDLQIANLALSQLSYCPTLPLHTGGESGIRTHGSVLRYTRFPVVHLRPLGHLSSPQTTRERWSAVCDSRRDRLAERVGFEPTVTRRPQRFSRPPLSTTQAPLLHSHLHRLSTLTTARSQPLEEGPEKSCAVALQYAYADLADMVEPGVADHVPETATGAPLGVECPEDEPGNSRQHHRPRTHSARL